MKKIISTVAAAVFALALSTNTFAHSHLSGSNPTDGSVVTEPLQEISLDFDGKIMEGSFIELTNSQGVSVDIEDIIISERQLTGTVATPLENELYNVKWSIVSADGHALEGDFGFTVEVPVTETASDDESQVNGNTVDSQSYDATQADNKAQSEDEPTNLMTMVVLVVAIVIIIAGLLLLKKRKK